MNILGDLGFGSSHLIRNFSIDLRIQHRQQTLKKYKNKFNKEISDEIVMIVESMDNGFWKNQSIIISKNVQANMLNANKAFHKNEKEAIQFCTAKNKKILTPNNTIRDIYDNYHDPDDKMLYVILLRENSF